MRRALRRTQSTAEARPRQTLRELQERVELVASRRRDGQDVRNQAVELLADVEQLEEMIHRRREETALARRNGSDSHTRRDPLPPVFAGNADPHLVALARAADLGERCPYVTLLVGEMEISGWPVESGSIVTGSAEALLAQYQRALDSPNRSEDLHALVEEQMDVLRRFGEACTPSDTPAALTLGNAHLAARAGSPRPLPVIRVPLSAVGAWFIGAA